MGCSSAAETPCLVAQSQRGPKSPTPPLRTPPQRVGDGYGAPPTGQPPSQPPPPCMQRGAGRQSGRQVLSERRGCARPDWRVSGTAICPEACRIISGGSVQSATYRGPRAGGERAAARAGAVHHWLCALLRSAHSHGAAVLTGHAGRERGPRPGTPAQHPAGGDARAAADRPDRLCACRYARCGAVAQAQPVAADGLGGRSGRAERAGIIEPCGHVQRRLNIPSDFMRIHKGSATNTVLGNSHG